MIALLDQKNIQARGPCRPEKEKGGVGRLRWPAGGHRTGQGNYFGPPGRSELVKLITVLGNVLLLSEKLF